MSTPNNLENLNKPKPKPTEPKVNHYLQNYDLKHSKESLQKMRIPKKNQLKNIVH